MAKPLLFFLAFLTISSARLLPEQFHLALAGDGEMRISFKLNSSAPQTCTFTWASSANVTSAPSTVRAYFPGNGFFHHVLLSNVPSSMVVDYSCAGGPWLTFLSAPPSATFTPFSLAVFGDWGYLGSKERGPSLPVGGLALNWSAVPVRELLEDLKNDGKIQMVLHTGDIGYYDDCFGEHLLKFCYENVTDGWFNWIQNLSSVMPFHVSAGNQCVFSPLPLPSQPSHACALTKPAAPMRSESECHSPSCILDLPGLGLHLNNFSAYKNRWEMNNQASGGVQNSECARPACPAHLFFLHPSHPHLLQCGTACAGAACTLCRSTRRRTGLARRSPPRGTAISRSSPRAALARPASTWLGSRRTWQRLPRTPRCAGSSPWGTGHLRTFLRRTWRPLPRCSSRLA